MPAAIVPIGPTTTEEAQPCASQSHPPPFPFTLHGDFFAGARGRTPTGASDRLAFRAESARDHLRESSCHHVGTGRPVHPIKCKRTEPAHNALFGSQRSRGVLCDGVTKHDACGFGCDEVRISIAVAHIRLLERPELQKRGSGGTRTTALAANWGRIARGLPFRPSARCAPPRSARELRRRSSPCSRKLSERGGGNAPLERTRLTWQASCKGMCTRMMVPEGSPRNDAAGSKPVPRGPLSNPDWATRGQHLPFNPDGTPAFGVPVADDPYQEGCTAAPAKDATSSSIKRPRTSRTPMSCPPKD